ncbi:MAG: hypothetical protein ACRDN9_13365 [Streptosporangiaceae bacterium]
MALGVALRVVVQLAYRPAILYIDSFGYLTNAKDLDPTMWRPVGYDALMVRWLLAYDDLSLITAVQHLLGLGMAVAIYALLVHRGVRHWVSALAAAPILLDGYQLQIEQNVMSDTLFQALLLGGAVLLAWRRTPLYTGVALAGLLWGLSVTVRLIGEPLVLAGVLYLVLVFRGVPRKALASGLLAACFAVPLVVYAHWFHAWTGEYGLNTKSAIVRYSRVAPFADCARLPARPSYLRALCPDAPPGQRPGVDYYAHSPASPVMHVRLPPGTEREEALRTFTRDVTRAQPVDYAAAVGRDFVKGFAPVRTTSQGDVSLERWRFTLTYPHYPWGDPAWVARHFGGGEKPHVVRPLATFLRAYQTYVYTWGTLLAATLLAGLLGAAGLVRARRSGLRAVSLLFSLAGGGMLLASATFEFSWRYELPALVLLPVAGVLGITAIVSRRPGRCDHGRNHDPDQDPDHCACEPADGRARPSGTVAGSLRKQSTRSGERT